MQRSKGNRVSVVLLLSRLIQPYLRYWKHWLEYSTEFDAVRLRWYSASRVQCQHDSRTLQDTLSFPETLIITRSIVLSISWVKLTPVSWWQVILANLRATVRFLLLLVLGQAETCPWGERMSEGVKWGRVEMGTWDGRVEHVGMRARLTLPY
jgi:hypothetical protein